MDLLPSTKRWLDKVMIENEKGQNEGYQIFALIDLKLYGVLEGPPNAIYENVFPIYDEISKRLSILSP